MTGPSTPPVSEGFSIRPTPTATETAVIVAVLLASAAGAPEPTVGAPRERSAWASSARGLRPGIGPVTSWRRSAATGWESA